MLNIEVLKIKDIVMSIYSNITEVEQLEGKIKFINNYVKN
jgi:hypothetical protein